ncbi:MAG: MFS transporter [Spirochaetales bacterium]|nr:MFS transporter [Spirochaetales bacterium]
MQKWKKNLYTVWFTQLFSLIGFGFGMPFLPFFIQDLGISDPAELKLWTGILTAAPAVALAVMAPVWGTLADKFGKKPMLLRAMIGGTIVMVGMGLSTSVYWVLFFRILQGLITGTVTSSAALVASGTPDNKLSYALGFVSSSTFIGYSLGPAAGGMIAEHFGYRMSFIIGAGIVLIGLFLVIFLIEEPVSETQEEGKQLDGSGSTAKGGSIITSSIIMLFLLFFFMRLSRTLPTPFLPLYIQELRGTIDGSARITGILSGGIGLMSAISGLTLSRLGDRMNRLTLLSILVGAGSLTSALIIFFPAFGTLTGALMLTFFLIGGVEPLLMSLTSERVSSKNRGFLFGIQTMVGSFAWFVSPMLGSWVSIKYSIPAIFLLFSITLTLTFIIALIVRKKIR